MIAGVGSIDLALLVVAADDGWMPQTEEHLQILAYLNVKLAIVALTKSDLGNVPAVHAQITEELRDTVFADAPIVPVSVRNDDGLVTLKNALISQLAKVPPQADIGKPRLFVDRAFSLQGVGTVVTGTLSGGKLSTGQRVFVQPAGIKTRIRSLQSHNRDLECALPGMRTAINLPDIDVGVSNDSIARGAVVTSEIFEPSSAIDVLLEKSARMRDKSPSLRLLKSGASVHLHYGTGRIPATIVLANQTALEPGKKEIAQLRLQSPVLAFIGDRFVIRDRAEQHTLAGGVVLDPDGTRGSFRSATQQKLLVARAAAPNDVDVFLASEIHRRGTIQAASLLQKSRFSREEIASGMQRLRQAGNIVMNGALAADARTWEAARKRAIDAIDQLHKKSPERAGVDLTELRGALPDQPSELIELLISDLCRADFVRTGSTIGRRSHHPVLPAHLQPTAAKVLLALSEKPFDPPGRKQIIPDAQSALVLGYLIKQGDVVEVGAEILLSQKAFAEIKNEIANFITVKGPATVSQLRQALGTSRRVIVPLLELLDRSGFTRRFGDERKLAKETVTTSSGALN
ncbi:MAG: Selenocysteine-specific translation elongation factor [Spartobacteria bacterium]|nr:Selenocysteine-specific translation elongation factor [Spartobacteria bacterium]